MDADLSLDAHISRTAQACFFQLRNISNIRKVLTKQSTVVLVLSLVISRLDYCNGLLAGASKVQIAKLQRIQNAAARLVSLCPKHSHITPILRELHWLPIQQRICYKIMCLTYQCLSGVAPSYLRDLICEYTPARSLRSESKHLLCIPKVKSVNFGHRSFAYFAASEWNNLPLNIRTSPTLSSFKTNIKTYLFQIAFP